MNKIDLRLKLTEFDRLFDSEGRFCLTARQRKRIARLLEKINKELYK